MVQPYWVASEHRHFEESEEESSVITKPREEVQLPKFFEVLLHNDDYTPMDFVVEILEDFFNKSSQEAQGVMLEVHNKGVGVGGTYPKEIAETKVDLVHKYAYECDYPLKCTLREQS